MYSEAIQQVLDQLPPEVRATVTVDGETIFFPKGTHLTHLSLPPGVRIAAAPRSS